MHELTALERQVLNRLSSGPWTSPPLFDHMLLARLAKLGLVQIRVLPSSEFVYSLIETGRSAITQDDRR